MKNSVFLFFILVILNENLYSQNLFDIRSMSMGNTSAASSFDLDAFNQNPANIIKQRSNNNAMFYFNIVTNAGVFINSDYLSLDFYNDYFTKDADGNTRFLTEQDKSNILNEAGDQPVNFLASTKILSVIYNSKKSGSFGISLNEKTNGNFIAGKDFLQLALYGNQSNTFYDLSNNTLNDYWIRELNLSYANTFSVKNDKLFDEISYGASVKPQFGIYYLSTQSNNLNVYTNDSNVIQSSGSMEFLYSGLTDDNSFKYSTGKVGFGLGFDVGVNARIKNFSKNGQLNLGLSIIDIGYVNWSENTFKYFYNGNYVITNITEKSQIDSLKDQIKGTKTPTADFTTGLPTTLRFGISYRLFSGKNKKDSLNLETVNLTMDYVQGFNNNLGGTTKPIIGIGAEYNVTKVLSSRAGFAFGGREKFVMSIGLGIDTGPVIIDIGTYNIASLFTPKSTSKYSA
ncbi:MAG: DUF5723 family protein, partial [bacterium]